MDFGFNHPILTPHEFNSDLGVVYEEEILDIGLPVN